MNDVLSFTHLWVPGEKLCMGKPSPQLSTGPPQSRGGALRAGDILLAAARMWVLPPLQPAHLPPQIKNCTVFLLLSLVWDAIPWWWFISEEKCTLPGAWRPGRSHRGMGCPTSPSSWVGRNEITSDFLPNFLPQISSWSSETAITLRLVENPT